MNESEIRPPVPPFTEEIARQNLDHAEHRKRQRPSDRRPAEPGEEADHEEHDHRADQDVP